MLFYIFVMVWNVWVQILTEESAEQGPIQLVAVTFHIEDSSAVGPAGSLFDTNAIRSHFSNWNKQDNVLLP